MDISFVIVALVSTLQCLGTFSGNILEGKPSKQSRTRSASYSHLANDGDIRTISISIGLVNPYWEADLGGYYNVTKITVTGPGGWAEFLMGAVVEIATSSVSTCPESNNTFICGHWPDEDLPEVSITFNCSYSAVRYVRIRREFVDYLSIAEVAAEGFPSILPVQQSFDKMTSKKVTKPIKSLSVDLVTECGTMCHYAQSCLAFSFSKRQKPNCLLAIDTSMTTDAEWVGYKFKECMEVPTPCPPIG